MGQGKEKSNVTLTPMGQSRPKEVKVSEKPRFHLHVDADRDGKVDDNPHGVDKWEWGKGKRGAVIAVNCNASGKSAKRPNSGSYLTSDLEDDSLNGEADIKDLTVIQVRRTGPLPPSSWKLELSVDEKVASKIRIFDAKTPSAKEIIGPSSGAVHTFKSVDFDVKELLCEALEYATASFDGLVYINLILLDGASIIFRHKACLRVAPWIMFNHLDKPEKILVADVVSNAHFLGALQSAASTAGLPVDVVSTDECRGDRWMQDIMEFGYHEAPGRSPQRNVIETPRGRELAGFPKALLCEEIGYFIPSPHREETDSSLNYGGNLECTPPFTAPSGKVYPFGRMYLCDHRTADGDKIDPVFKSFLERQVVQRPIYVDAGWLAVGHVDEIITFVPADTSLGFKLLLASPRLGFRLLKQAASKGGRMLLGRKYVDGIGAELEVAEFLSNGIDWKFAEESYTEDERSELSYIMSARQIADFNKFCQNKVDAIERDFKHEMGLTSTDIDYVPIVYVHSGLYGATGEEPRADALTAGMVNMLVLGSRCIAPIPFGPVVDGEDLFEECFRGVLKKCGLSVTFVDDWDTYHTKKGEIHCGTNTLRKVRGGEKWWEFVP